MHAEQRTNLTLLVPAALLATFALAYLVVGKEMNMILQGLLAVILLVVCFFNIRLSLVLLTFSMLLSPEIAVASTSSRDVTIRGEDIFLTCMTLGWIFRVAIFKDIGFTRKNPLNMPMLIYSLAAIISTALGIWRGDVKFLAGFFFVLKMIEYFVLFILVVNYLHEEPEISAFLTMMLVVWGIVVGYGLAMAATGGDVAAPFEGSRAERNTLSGYLILVGAVAGGVIARDNPSKEKKWLLAGLIGMCVVLLFSVSRSGWISAAVVFSILFFFAPPKQKQIYILVVCVFVLVIPYITPEVVTKRLDFTFNQYSSVDKQLEIFGIRFDTSSSARFYAALMVLEKFTNHAIFGHGITGFQFLDGQFFRILAEMGLVGITSFLWLLYSVHNVILRAIRVVENRRLNGMAVGMYAAFWALIIHAFSANTFIIVRICEPFWFLVGLTLLATDVQQDRIEAALEPKQEMEPRTRSYRRQRLTSYARI